MARPHKIRTSGNEGLVRKLASEGKTSREISDALKERGLDIGHVAVSRFITEETEERREIARSVASEQAFDAVPVVTRWMRDTLKDLTRVRELSMHAFEAASKSGAEEMMLEHGKLIARLAGPGAAVGKALIDITVGEQPTSEVDALHDRIQSILKAKKSASTE